MAPHKTGRTNKKKKFSLKVKRKFSLEMIHVPLEMEGGSFTWNNIFPQFKNSYIITDTD